MTPTSSPLTGSGSIRPTRILLLCLAFTLARCPAAVRAEERVGVTPPPKPAGVVGITYATSAADLLDCLAGPDVVISNAVLTSAPLSAGTFTGGISSFGFNQGIVLSTGDIIHIVGPNESDSATGSFGTAGDADLTALLGGIATYDAAVLEFDCDCAVGTSISLQYLFGSEEYNEYVNAINDAFAFFVDGEQMAFVPVGCSHPGIPVTTSNVSCGKPYDPPNGTNCNCYRNNDLDDGGGGIDSEMDGMTQTFFATIQVGEGSHHVKIAIADALDTAFDSAVLIRCGSLTCTPPPPTGACCFQSGQCVALEYEDCVSQVGNYYGDAIPCDPNPCAQPVGACCNPSDYGCRMIGEDGCTSIGWIYAGDGTTCATTDCHEVPAERMSWGRLRTLYR